MNPYPFAGWIWFNKPNGDGKGKESSLLKIRLPLTDRSKTIDDKKQQIYTVQSFCPPFWFLFNLLIRSHSVLTARVRILGEVNLPSDSLYECRSFSLDKHRLGKASASRAAFQRRLYRSQYSVPYSVWPSWLHQSYDLQLLDQQARSTLLIRSLLPPNPVPLLDPVGLSYWMAHNLPMEYESILNLTSAIHYICKMKDQFEGMEENEEPIAALLW